MISLMDKQKIIIDGFLGGKSQWSIHRETGIDRKTIRKYIREYEEKRAMLLEGEGDKLILTEEIVEPPKYDVSNRTKVKLTDEIMDKIDFYLEENKKKIQEGKSKQQKKRIDIHECLEEEGYDISYSTVCNYIKNKLNEKKEAYIRQEYDPGDVSEFDWGHVKLEISGESKAIQMAVIMYYGFKYRFCNARRGNEKGHVERSVEYVRRKIFSKKDSFETLEEANEYLKEELKKLNSKPQKHNKNKSAKEFLEEEVPYLIKLVPSYDISKVVELRVNKYSVINIEENKYSVPDSLVGKFVTAKIYPNNILVYHESELIAEHIRSFGANTWNIKIEHYLNTLKKKPGTIHRSTAMRQMNSKLQDIYTKYYTQNPKDFIELIELISKEGLEKIEDSIKELEKINPLNIDTEKIKLLCNRQKEIIDENKYKNTEIEEHSKLILNHYGDLLKNSSGDFDKEALII